MTSLPPEKLRQSCDPAILPFRRSDEIEGESALVGQERALDAIRLSAEIPHRDFNVFVLGPAGSGRHTATRAMLAEQAARRPVPRDWVYVNNFDAPHRPKALSLPPGMAERLRRAMEDLVDDVANDIPAMFESDEYQTQRRAIEEELGGAQEAAMAEFVERARAENVAVVRTPMGFMLTALRDGKPVGPEEYHQLSEAERAEIDEKIARLQEELAEVLRRAPLLERELRRRLMELHAAMAERAVTARMDEIDLELKALAGVPEYLRAVHADMVANAELFLQVAARHKGGPFPEAIGRLHTDPAFDRYRVNVMVSHDGRARTGAPVVSEELPSYDRLVGRIEHVAQMGSLVTNFTLIRPGALHRANGGYLMLDARDVLAEPLAWDALKRSLKSRAITITSMAERMSLLSTVSLEPDPIPLDVRVVLIGDRLLHALLVLLDPDFGELFKVQADFEEELDRTEESLRLYARLIGSYARREGLKPLAAEGMARLLDEATRLAADTRKLSLRLGALSDILREADHYAAGRDSALVEAQDVERAVQEKERRAARLRERMQEEIARGTILIDTEGAKIGQVNGLSVIGLGDYSFGRPSRITARVRMGSGKLVDIEREVELGGPLHSKGVMILAGYLMSRYALDVPFSLHASLVFEQSYGGVEGDSASLAELCALLSALAELPLRQDLAMTGSVSQSGEVQAIGGVNEKIEGFFETCDRRGLTGTQGVIIPQSNVEHLMLRREVVEAAEAGRFQVIPVRRVDEAIGILTGVEAGERGADGRFPAGSVNARVEERLRSFAEARRAFLRSAGETQAGNGREEEGG